MKVFTIGFTRKTAEQFFGKLQRPGLLRLVDVRLNNVSQLAGFAKRDDLRYFVKAICGIEYIHATELAPTQDMLDEYKKQKGAWDAYERRFLGLMQSRRIEDTVPREMLDGGCLLCSEDRPDHCHRRLVLEYLRERWGGLEIEHIV
jgi:uncharacterized protein (DUF488 family)